jgi:ADP-ribosyl-[dinitrogen reductase] hydrolase
MWSIYHTTSFDEAVVKSVNLLGDADSHGSITGQLAGALYGYSSIHPQFNEWLARWDDYEIAIRALLLHDIGGRAGADEAMETGPLPSRVNTKTISAKICPRFTFCN